jgi:hypothetical protein
MKPMPARRHPATVCGHPLTHSAHICAFFDSEKQEYECLVPYFAEGLARGEQVVTIRDSAKCGAHIDRLRASGAIPVADAMKSNRLRVVASEETYLQNGVFEVDRMYRMIKTTLEEADREGFTRVRTCGDMSWALRDMPGTEELMQYESQVNQLIVEHDCTLMCTYDVNRFSGRAIMDVLATHPAVLLGDRIYENPYYQAPREFLQTLLRRGSTPLGKVAREPEPARA